MVLISEATVSAHHLQSREIPAEEYSQTGILMNSDCTFLFETLDGLLGS